MLLQGSQLIKCQGFCERYGWLTRADTLQPDDACRQSKSKLQDGWQAGPGRFEDLRQGTCSVQSFRRAFLKACTGDCPLHASLGFKKTSRPSIENMQPFQRAFVKACTRNVRCERRENGAPPSSELQPLRLKSVVPKLDTIEVHGAQG